MVSPAGGTLRLLAYVCQHVGREIGADLDAIAEAAFRNNPGLGLTGALFFDGGRFVQVLEGPHDAVEMLLSRIRSDNRARDLDILFDTVETQRSMSEWSMWIGRFDDSARIDVDDIKAFRDAYLQTFRPDAMDFVMLFRRLIEQSEQSPSRLEPPGGPV